MYVYSCLLQSDLQNNREFSSKIDAPAKDVRRDSKGFENFDDYFESDGNDTTINTAGEKTNESIEDVSVTEVS